MRDIRHREKRFTREFDRTVVADRAGVTATRRVEHVGAGALRGCEQGIGAKAEHAGIPYVLAGIEIRLRLFAIGFFHEGGNFPASTLRNLRTHADVAEAGFRTHRRNAEGDQQTILRRVLPARATSATNASMSLIR